MFYEMGDTINISYKNIVCYQLCIANLRTVVVCIYTILLKINTIVISERSFVDNVLYALLPFHYSSDCMRSRG